MAARIGQLDQRITFQQRVRVGDGIGGDTMDWENIATTPTVWARVIPKSGGEDTTDARVEATHRVVFQVRMRTDIDETMRVLWDGRAHNIRHVAIKSSRELYLEIEAEAGAAP